MEGAGGGRKDGRGIGGSVGGVGGGGNKRVGGGVGKHTQPEKLLTQHVIAHLHTCTYFNGHTYLS